jgi:hypothetical protein
MGWFVQPRSLLARGVAAGFVVPPGEGGGGVGEQDVAGGDPAGAAIPLVHPDRSSARV